MKPGGICKTSKKRCYGSHEEAVRKGMKALGEILVKEFSAYNCPHCKCWHLTTQPQREYPEREQSRQRLTRMHD